MQIILERESWARLEDILEQLQIRYDLVDLSPEDLVESLIDLGYDIVMQEQDNISLSTKLIEYCSDKQKAEKRD